MWQTSATRDAYRSEGFDKNHTQLSKPADEHDPIYAWTLNAVQKCAWLRKPVRFAIRIDSTVPMPGRVSHEVGPGLPVSPVGGGWDDARAATAASTSAA